MSKGPKFVYAISNGRYGSASPTLERRPILRIDAERIWVTVPKRDTVDKVQKLLFHHCHFSARAAWREYSKKMNAKVTAARRHLVYTRRALRRDVREANRRLYSALAERARVRKLVREASGR